MNSTKKKTSTQATATAPIDDEAGPISETRLAEALEVAATDDLAEAVDRLIPDILSALRTVRHLVDHGTGDAIDGGADDGAEAQTNRRDAHAHLTCVEGYVEELTVLRVRRHTAPTPAAPAIVGRSDADALERLELLAATTWTVAEAVGNKELHYGDFDRMTRTLRAVHGEIAKWHGGPNGLESDLLPIAAELSVACLALEHVTEMGGDETDRFPGEKERDNVLWTIRNISERMEDLAAKYAAAKAGGL